MFILRFYCQGKQIGRERSAMAVPPEGSRIMLADSQLYRVGDVVWLMDLEASTEEFGKLIPVSISVGRIPS